MESTFTCNLCEALCGLRVTQDEAGRVLGVRGNPADVFSKGHICPKAPALRELHDDPDRLREPLRRTASGWERIGWDEALDLAASRLNEVREKHGKDAVALYVGTRAVHNHRTGLASQVLSAALGTRNCFDPNSQDSNPRLFACLSVYGDALSMPVPDIDRTDFLLVLGANPAASGGSQMVLGDVRGRLRAVRERGGRVVLVDPRRTETAAYCDEHHFIRPGGDAALLLAMLSVLFGEGRVDEAAVARVASGLGDLRMIARRFTPERVSRAVGVEPGVIRRLARDFAGARRACAYARVGVCQSEFGPLVCWLVEALNIVTGNFDRPGGAMFPAPAVDIAPIARLLAGGQVGRWRSRVRGLPEFLGSLPSAVMAEEIEAPGEGQIRALVSFAGNPVLSTPNGKRLERAIEKLDFVLGVDFYVNETTRHAHLIVPPAHVFETGNFDLVMLRFAVRNVVKYSPPIAPKAPGARDDWEIASELSARLLAPGLPWAQRAARRMAERLPERLVDWLLRAGPYGLDLDKVKAAPDGIDLGPLEPRRAACVRTPDGLARLSPRALVADVPRLERWVDAGPSPELRLVGRRHLRGNNSWMHNLPSLVKGPDRATLMMHPLDAARLGLASGAKVRVTSRSGEIVAPLSVTDEIMPGVVSFPHGYGHAALGDRARVASRVAGPSANELTDEERVEPVLGTSILNGLPVTVGPA